MTEREEARETICVQRYPELVFPDGSLKYIRFQDIWVFCSSPEESEEAYHDMLLEELDDSCKSELMDAGEMLVSGLYILLKPNLGDLYPNEVAKSFGQLNCTKYTCTLGLTICLFQ